MGKAGHLLMTKTASSVHMYLLWALKKGFMPYISYVPCIHTCILDMFFYGEYIIQNYVKESQSVFFFTTGH